MKKLISILLALSLLAIVFSGCDDASTQSEKPQETTTTTLPVSSTASPAEDFEYTENDDGTLAITSYTGSDADVVIPDSANGCAVTVIEKGAFSGNTTLVSVTIPANITRILRLAFSNCTALESVTLYEGLVSIGPYCFADCTSLTTITLPDGLKEISSSVFSGCSSLSRITIPTGVVTLGKEAFANSGLTDIVFNDGVLVINENTFSGTPLRTIQLPSTVKIICSNAFCNCPQLEMVSLNEGLKTLSSEVFYNCPKLTEVTIPASVVNIYPNSFLCNETLSAVKFEGNAPTRFEPTVSEGLMNDDEKSSLYTYIIYYHEGAEGFTSPEWNGYQTAIW